VLLPQGAGILAGAAFIGVGGLLLFVLPLPAKLSAETAIAWLGVCVVSPAIARFFIKLVAPNTLQSDRLNAHSQLQPWEIGTALLLISTFMSSQTIGKITNLLTSNQSWQLLTLICGWLSISIGVCILAFVRRTPLWNKL
jgi:ABC-type transport system involved in multi-copper enzyme maturation permease subunit